MDELKQALDSQSEVLESESLRRAGIYWATTCLNDFEDALLRKGLAISAAITDFCNELEKSK